MSKQKPTSPGAAFVAEVEAAVAAIKAAAAPTDSPPQPQPKTSKGRWVAVRGPRTWRPDDVGATLTGVFLGTKTLHEVYGPYEAAVVARQVNATDVGEILYVPGVVVVTALEAVLPQTRVMIEYKGLVEPADPSRNAYRDYSVAMWMPS